MLHSICNKKGFGLIEVLIAIFLTAVGIMALLSLLPTGWQTMAKSDQLGRASGILYKTLESSQSLITNPCNIIASGEVATEVRVSGESAGMAGDMTYNVNTKIAQDGTNLNAFLITVTVTWPKNPNGISESLFISRQELSRFPEGCVNNSI